MSSGRIGTGQTLFVALGLIVFLAGWVALCGTGFYWLYGNLSRDQQAAAESLKWLTWPFVFMAALGPMFMLIWMGGLRVVRDVLQLQNLIGTLPEQAEKMQVSLIDFQDLTTGLTRQVNDIQTKTEAMRATVKEFDEIRAQLLTDVSRVNESQSAASASDGVEVGEAQQLGHLQEFQDLFAEAQKFFYGALGRYNSPRENPNVGEPLIVQSGAGNFSRVTETLRSGGWFRKKDAEGNNRVAGFILRAFELERTTRGSARSNMTAKTVEQLRDLRPPPPK